MLELNPEPLVEINPLDAEARNIADSDMVIVFNGRARTTLKARITEGVGPGVININQGWWIDQFKQGSVNHLTHDVINPVQEKVYEPNVHMNDVAMEVEKYKGPKLTGIIMRFSGKAGAGSISGGGQVSSIRSA